MNAVGVIAEFNPFHNGHKYLIDAIREELNPDGIVCVMSGDFVQRGYPAITDKWARAKAAVSSGADLVIELPAVFSLSSAEDFAYGGVRILEGLGCINTLAFGSESADLNALRNYAAINTENSDELKAYLKEGISYPAALERLTGTALEPNDILAALYIKALKSIKPYAIKRKGRGHIATASYIRENLAELESFVPEDALFDLCEFPFWDEAADKRLFEMLRYALLMKPTYELAEIAGVSEGIENALKKAAIDALSTDDIILKAKSKRYTYARISRILMCIALDINKSVIAEAKEQSLYARVLALNENGSAILKEAKKSGSIDIISKLKKSDVILKPYKNILETDVQSSDLYSILTGRDVREYSDFARTPRLE